MGFWLVGVVLAFSFLGIVWHDDMRHGGSCSSVHEMMMLDCPVSSGVEMIEHHLGFFLGVMQATNGFGLAFLVLFVTFRVGEWHSALLFLQHLLSCFRAYSRRLLFLRDDLAGGFRKYFSWLSMTHAFFPAR